jgi:hypothetical protein
MRHLRWAAAFSALIGVWSCGGDDTPAADGGVVEASTVVVLPDTQFYACAYPEIFESQARFITSQHAARGIGLVLHTGDIVDSDIDPQWQVASDSLHRLDGVVPYLVVSGNHDLEAGRSTLMGHYFDARLLDAFEPPNAAYQPPAVENSYAVVPIAGLSWLFLGLEFGPRDAVVQWADAVLKQHAELPAVVFTHAYLYSDGNRYDRTRMPRQPYHPDDYALTPDQGINDGEDLWRKLIEPNENVRLVLSGHVIPDGQARSLAQRMSGTIVAQVLANYQLCDACPCSQVEGGGGYLRMLTFSPDGLQIQVTTYSPHFDRWLRDDENQFALTFQP